MQDLDDLALLKKYAETNNEAAFAEVVVRQIGFVYSSALRQVHNPDLASEITQAVFTLLAQKSSQLSSNTILTGWLFKTTRYVALAQIRAETKRRQHEQEARMQTELQNEADPTASEEMWQQLSPLLDEAIASLGETDRQAVLLRFFENRSLAEVGKRLGIGEDTARKRVTRAMEKLHRYFSNRGLGLTTAIIAGALSAHSVQAAPVAMAKTVAILATAQGAATGTSTLTLIKGALKLMAWAKVKTAAVVGISVLLAAGTATVAVKKIHNSRYDDSWRTRRGFSSDMFHQAAPQITLLPAKNPGSGGWGSGRWGNNDEFLGGISMDGAAIVQMAYGGFPPTRTLFVMVHPDAKFKARYDVMANLPKKSAEALKQKVKEQFGVVARREQRETNVLFLTLKRPGAQGLRPAKKQFESSQSSRDNELLCENQSVSSVVSLLEHTLGIPVIDKTGLQQHYDIDLKWDKIDPDHASLKAALLSQLGLELVPGREAIEMLIVEKAK